MTTTTLSPDLQQIVAQFRRDPPLHNSFPLRLNNGATIPAFTANCGCCRQEIDPEMVHGTVVDSLPTVKTIRGHGYCVSCERMISIDGRFRAVRAGYHFEFMHEGKWHTVGTPNSNTMMQRIYGKLVTLFRQPNRSR